MSDPRPAPAARPRALELIRVSREGGRGERLLSPAIQHTAIVEYCDRHGYDITQTVEAIDESGSRKKSSWWPRLDQAIELIEAGTVDVIVAWEFSRAARNRLRWAVALDRVETAGGRIESATEPVDVTTAAGRFQRGMLAEMHAYKAEATGEAWKDVHRNRLSRGLPATGGPRFGYTLTDGRYEPDPGTGPVLAELYRRATRGDSMMSLAEWLNREHIPTLTGGSWSRSRIRPILDSGFGAGLITAGRGPQREYHPGIHDPVIDEPTWTAYRQQRDLAPYRPQQNAARYPLTGIIFCGDCGSRMSMTTRTTNGRTQRVYACNRAQKYRDVRFVTTLQDRVETWVKHELEQFAVELDTEIRERAKRRRRKVSAINDPAVISRKLAKVERMIAAATDNLNAGLLSPDEFTAAVTRYRTERADLLARKASHVSTGPDDTRQLAATARTLLTAWEHLQPAELRALLATFIDRITVTPPPPGTSARAGATYEIKWRFDT